MATEPPRHALCCGKAPDLQDLSLLGAAQCLLGMKKTVFSVVFFAALLRE